MEVEPVLGRGERINAPLTTRDPDTYSISPLNDIVWVGNDFQHLFNGPRPRRIYYTLPFDRSIFKEWQPHSLMVSNKIPIFDASWPRPRCTSTVYDSRKGRASFSGRRDDRPRTDRERIRHAIHAREPVLCGRCRSNGRRPRLGARRTQYRYGLTSRTMQGQVRWSEGL